MGYESEMDGCGRFMKRSLFFVNFIVFIGGLTLVGLSIYALVDKVHYVSELTGNDLISGTIYILLVSGLLVSIVAFLGCYGALREIRCMLFLYFLILLLLFVVILIGGILGYVYRERFVDSLQQQMTNSLRLYNEKRDIREAWDYVQSQLHCCGVNSWNQWHTYVSRIPDSCCKLRSLNQYHDCNSDGSKFTYTTGFTQGCLMRTKEFMQSHSATLGFAGISLSVIILLGMIFACALFKMIQ